MRSEADDPAYLLDMLSAARDIQGFLRGVKRHAFLGDKKLQAAVERKIEIIGEAARLVTRPVQGNPPRDTMAADHRAAEHRGP